jgi:hypothetical protein
MLFARSVLLAAIIGLLSACAPPPASHQLSVNGHTVSLSLYQALVKAQQQRVERTGLTINWSSPAGRRRLAQIRSAVVQGLVRSAVIDQLAETHRISVSQDEVASAVSKAEQALGGHQAFGLALEQAGTTESVFASLTRDRLLEAKLRLALGAGFGPTLEGALADASVIATGLT